MNEPVIQHEFVFRRLAEAARFGSTEVNGNIWLAIVIPVLIVGLIYIIWMYIRDSRTIAWPFAVALGLLRTTVYAILALVFLLPAWQSWETVQKQSRVVVLVDVSPSMAEKSDDLPPVDGSPFKPATRLDKVVQFLTNENAAFVQKLCERNPVYVYRFGARLDEEPAVLEQGQALWPPERWQQWLRLDLKRWLLDQLDGPTRIQLEKHSAFEADRPGTANWAAQWLKRPVDEVIPAGLDEPQREKFISVRSRLDRRIEANRQLLTGTDVGASVLQALTKESGNMPQAVIVLTDGRGTLGSEISLTEAAARANKDHVPLIAVMVGEDRPPVEIRIADVQTPEQTPPNEKFIVRAELDGIGLPETEVTVFLDVLAPNADKPTHTIEDRIKFQSGSPPHAIAEFALDPSATGSLPEQLFSADKKEFIEGEWKFVVRVPRDSRETFAAKEHMTEPVSVHVLKKPLRVLLVASGPTHDYQFLRTLMVRETDQKRAELSIFLQNEGRDGRGMQDVPPERLLNRFPSILKTEDDGEEKPEDRFYNLARYDVIVAYDPDWSEFTAEQLDLLKKWVDTQAGGLILVAGPVNTFQLARGEDGGRLKPLLDLFPVVPGDSVLMSSAARKNTRTAWRLNFAAASPDMDFLKLDDDSTNPLAGWKQFFDGNNSASGQPPTRGFYSAYPVKSIKPGATAAATVSDPSYRTADGKEHPFLVTMPYGKGRVVFLGSSETRRLRQYRDVFYERFWMKLARWSAAGGRTRQHRRGVLVMGREFASGGYVRIETQLFGPTLEPLPRSTRAKAIVSTADGSDRQEHELTAKPSVADWAGWFQTRFIAAQPGDYKLEIPIPNSGDVLRGKFSVKAMDPELNNAQPDPAALLQLAAEVKDIEDRLPQGPVRDEIRSRLQDGSKPGAQSPKLVFQLANADVIPLCMTTQKKEQRNRGAYDDIWDDGLRLGRTSGGRPIEVGAVLLIVVGLLSAEWLGRKLLRLA